MGLDDQLKGVTSESPPDEVDLEENLDEAPGEVPGDQPDGKDGEPKGRTLENVRHELLRKQDKFQRQMMQEVRKLAEAVSVNPVRPTQQPGNTLDSMSIAELKQFRGQVPEEQMAAYDEYLTERIINDRVDQKVDTMSRKQNFEQSRQAAVAEALRQYPELKDPGSDFYFAVDQRLSEWGTGESDPRAVLNAANAVALEQGMLPAKLRRAATQQAPAPREGKPVPKDKSEDDDILNSEEAKKIAARLADAMPDGKFTDEQMERIRERAKYYKDNLQLYLKG